MTKMLQAIMAATTCAVLSSLSSAAIYTNSAVTTGTLAEADAQNVYNAYTGALDAKIGAAGVANVSFAVTNGSQLNSNNLFVGNGIGADGCSAVVDNSAASLVYWVGVGTTNSTGGQGGNNGSLLITNGGSITSGTTTSYQYHYIGTDNTTNSDVTVSGTGSRLAVKRIVRIRGTNSTLTLVNGGMAASSGNGDGGFSITGATNFIQLNGGYLVAGRYIPAEASIKLFDGTQWQALTGLDQTQRDTLGYTVTTFNNAADFTSATGLSSAGLDFGTEANPYTLTVIHSSYFPVPEPASLGLFAVGSLLVAYRRRR